MADQRCSVEVLTVAASKASFVVPDGTYRIHIKAPDGAISVLNEAADSVGYPLAQSTELLIERDPNGSYLNGFTLYFKGTTSHTIALLYFRRKTW